MVVHDTSYTTHQEDNMQAHIYRYIEWIWIAVGAVWLIARALLFPHLVVLS